MDIPAIYGGWGKLTIRSHTPPTPLGSKFAGSRAIRQRIYGLKEDSRVDRFGLALEHPPVETDPPAHIETHTLTLKGRIGHQDLDRGPVLFLCYLDDDGSSKYVAKVFDGLCYPLVDPCGFDCMYLADMHYSREARAYQEIPLSLQGSAVPKYFGSWTFSVTKGAQARSVRMVLLEYIDGESMQDIIDKAAVPDDEYEIVDYKRLPPEDDRIEVLAKVMETEVALVESGVNHCDTAPRNVIIGRKPDMDRVVVLDFNRASISKYVSLPSSQDDGICDDDDDPPVSNPLPMSPIEHYWRTDVWKEFTNWIPECWTQDLTKAHVWLCRRWGASDKYRPLSDFFLSRYGNDPLLQRELGVQKPPGALCTDDEDEEWTSQDEE